MATISLRYFVDDIRAESKQILVENPSGNPVEQAWPSGAAEK